MPRKDFTYGLPLIVILALAVRLIQLGSRNFWYDEAFAVLFAQNGPFAMLYGTLAPVPGGASDIHPLLYYTTLFGWMYGLGQDPFIVRLWSVIPGIVTVYVMYLLGRDLFSKSTGLAAVFITALAPFHVQYSQEARMYSLLGLLLMTATWCFVRGWRSEKIGWWVSFGLLSGLAMYTQQLAAFYLLALGLVPIITMRWNKLIYVIGGALLALMLYLPWLINLPSQLSKIQAQYWVVRPGIAEFLRTTFAFLVVNIDIPRSFFIPALIGAVILALFLAVQVFLYLRRPRARQTDRKPLTFALWLVVIPVMLMWLVSQVQPVYIERALIPSALMLYLVLGWFFTRSGVPRPILAIIGVIGLGLASVGLYHQYTWSTFPNSPFREAATYIRSNFQRGDVVIHEDKISALPMIYYDRALPQRYLADPLGSPEDTLALPTQQALGLVADNCVQIPSRGKQRVWFVEFAFTRDQYERAGRLNEYTRSVDWLDTHFARKEKHSFNDLDIILYSEPDDAVRNAVCEAVEES
jgi:mannosyltransferase